MDGYIDWNCRLFSSPCDLHALPEDVAFALELLRGRFGFSNFLMTPEFCFERESVSACLIRCRREQRALTPHLSSAVKIKYAPAARLSPGLSFQDGLERLTLGDGRSLPLLLPMSSYEDWIDTELNRLLFQRQMRPMFLSFDYATILYPQASLEKLLRISGAVYQFHYKALALPFVCEIVRRLLRQNATVVLGTGLDHPQKVDSYDAEELRAAALQFLTEAELQILLRNGRALWASIHSRAVPC